jgi:hypothetical protein
MHQYDAEMRANHAGFWKQPQQLIRRRGSCNVEVFRSSPEQQIPHASTHQPGGVAVLSQPSDNRPRQNLVCHDPHTSHANLKESESVVTLFTI